MADPEVDEPPDDESIEGEGVSTPTSGLLSGLFSGGAEPVSQNRMRAWKAADARHNMALPPEVRNSRANELGDHYSVGADLGPVVGPAVGLAQETIGRPLLSAFPDLGNAIAPSVFNFKTPSNTRPGAIDPYTMPTPSEALSNLRAVVAGSLDRHPIIQRLLRLGYPKTQ